MSMQREAVITSRAAESYVASEGCGPANELDLRSNADALARLFETAMAQGVVRDMRGMRVLISPPHLFVFHEDRLHRYIHKYMRIDGEASDPHAVTSSAVPIESEVAATHA
jgi:hypothetical protein